MCYHFLAMIITWHGLSCFSITSKTVSGEVALVIDPYQNETGLRFPRTLEAHLIVTSHSGDDANNLEAVQAPQDARSFVVDLPGEYEVKGLFVYGFQASLKDNKADHRIFRIEVEGVTIAHLGALNRPLTDQETQELGTVDVLILPVGGGRVMNADTAVEVIEQVEPRLVIPCTFALANLKETLADVNVFCKAIGSCQREESAKLKLTRKDLPEEAMMVKVLTRE